MSGMSGMRGMRGLKGLNGLRAEAVNPDSQPTVNRQSRLTSVQRHYSVTSARVAREWLKFAAMLVILFTLGVEQMWAATETRTATMYFTTSGGTNSGNLKDTVYYFDSSTAGFSGSITNIVSITTAKNDASTAPTIYTDGLRVYKKKNTSNGGSVTLTAGSDVVNITEIEVTAVDGYKRTTSYSVDNGSANVFTWDKLLTSTGTIAASTNVKIQVTESSNNTNQLRISKIVMTYTAEAAPSCSNSPTVGTVSANGSFNWSASPKTFPLSVSSIGSGDGCAISEYGFVWKSGGTDPTISDNKTTIGTSSSATSFSGNISGSFTKGTTYKVKAYVTNDGDNTTLSSSYTLIPRSVTFNMNSHGDAPATQYVADGEKATQPDDPTADGWTFGGWYKEAGCTNAWNFASDAVSDDDVTIYAKWTEAASLSSISVSTAPTKTKYLEGDNFDPTGLVITRTYSNSTSDTYTYAGHTSDFSFSPATNASLTTSNTSVTITYGGKTTTQSINVYTVTVNKVNMSGTAISNASVTASCSGRTLSQSVSTTNYKFNSWNVTAGGVSVSDNAITGTPTGNVTINAKFHDPITVAWTSNGATYSTGGPTTEVQYGTQWKDLTLPTDPSAPSSCSSKTFMGWTNMSDSWTGDTHDAAPTVCLKTFDGVTTAIEEDITFQAVFATGSGVTPVTYKLTKPSTSWSGYTTGTDTDDQGETWSYYAAGANQSGTYYYGLNVNALNYNIESPTFGNNITSIKLWVRNGSSTEARSVYICSSGETYNPSSGDLGSASIPKSNDCEVTASISGTFKHFYIYVSAALQIKYVEVTTGGITYADYVTHCCSALGTIGGAVTFNSPVEAKIKWNKISNVSSWTLKYKVHGAGAWSTAYTSKTSSDSEISESDDDSNGVNDHLYSTIAVSCNTAYDFLIIANPADGYCDKEEELNNSSSGYNSGTWSVSASITNGTKTSVPTTACGDYTATFAASSGYHFPAKANVAVTGASDFSWNTSTGVLSIDGGDITDDISISLICPPDACPSYAFWYGTTKTYEDNYECLSQVGSSTTWLSDVWTIPSANQWTYVGDPDWIDTYSGNLQLSDMKYALNRSCALGSISTGVMEGAQGYIRIYSDNTNAGENKYVGFIPAGYVLRWGTDGGGWTSVAFTGKTSDVDEEDWYTPLQTWSSSNADDFTYVGLKTSSGYVWSNRSETRRPIFLKPTSEWDKENAYFAAYYYTSDEAHNGWSAVMTDPDGDGIYEAWIPNDYDYAKVIFVRLSTNATGWGNKWNQTENLTLPSDKNVFTITGGGGDAYTGSWSLYDKKGTFHISANSNTNNWYCHFLPHHVLHYDANSGSGAPADQSIAVNASPCQLTVSTTEPTRSGYTFLGWNESSSATTPDGDWDGGDTHAMSGDVTLYAVWAANHTLAYNYNGGDGSSCSGGTYYTGQSFTACSSAGSKTGHTFTGWLGSNSTSYTAGTSYSMPNSDLTLTAQWSANSYSVTLNTNSGTINSGNVTSYTYGVGATLPTDVTRSGYRFDGWFDNSGLTGSAVTTISTTATGNKEYWAKWTAVYTVTWYVNGDEWTSGTVTGNTQVVSGQKVSALPTAPTKSDCDEAKVFVGWKATEISGTSVSEPSGIFTTQGGSPEITAKTDFYAVFADESGGDFTRVTNVSQLSVGKKVILGYEATAKSGVIVPVQSSALNGTLLYTGTTEGSAGYETLTISSMSTGDEAIYAFTLRAGYNSGYWAFEMSGDNAGKYLSHNGKNAITNAASVTSDGKTDFSIVLDANNVATITNKYGNENTTKDGSNYYNYKIFCYNYNNGTPRAAIYRATQTGDFVMYLCNPLTHSNYVTTCASCDADATFTNSTPVVSEIGCTGATLTATGGLKTLGASGCNVGDYGFVIGTADNPAIGGSGVTKLQVGTKNPTLGEDFSYDVTELTKGTHYYIRAYAKNKHGVAYSSSQNFWTKDVSSIAITTAPSKTNYIVGETFDKTGMVVTATMASGSTEDVTSDCTFSDAVLTSGTNQDLAINYTLCETEKSVNQKINVYTMSVSEGTNDSYGSYEYTGGTTFSVTPNSGKTYSLVVTNGTAVDNMDGTHTIINPTGNVTVTINYRNATTVKVYYKVDGNTVITHDVTESTTETLPTASDVATALAANDLELPEGTIYTNLWGWSETECTPQTEEPTVVSSPTINATKTFYAVYTNMYKKSIVGSDFNGTYAVNDGEMTIDGLKYEVSNICKQSNQVQFRSTPGYLYSKTALSYIKNIQITGLDLVVNACSDNSGSVDGSAITPTGTAPYVYTFPDNKQYFKITGKGGTDQVSRIDICYASATAYFMTTFCDDKIDAPTVTATKLSTASNKATVTLNWDEVSGATGYKVKWGSVSNSWEDVGTARTYTKTNLSSGSTYKWFVKAKYDAEDYCGAEITKGSTTVNTAYSVTYDANTTGYTGDVPAVSWYEPSLSVTVSTNELAKSRYHWDGWTPYNSSTPITVTAGAFTMPSANVTVKGGWTEVLSGDAVYITSAKDVTTMSSMSISVTRATYKSGTMTISNQTGDQGGTFHAVITSATADASDGLSATVKIEYTPSKANVTESATMTAVVGSESYDFTVYGRSLPTDFVIVAKVGGEWKALPADQTISGLQLGYSLTLDNTTTPTKATMAPAAALFNYYAHSAKDADYIRLAGKENSKALWSSTSNGIKVYAAIGGGSATGNQYEWKLSTSNNTTYTLHNDAANSGGGRDLGVNSDKKWGMHASATTTELRFLPVDATAEYIAMTVTSWGETSFTFTTDDDIPSYHHVAVECNGDSYSATMSGSGPYTINIPTMDFEDYSGASLVVQWQDNENAVLAQGAVLLPIFITGDNTDFEGYDPDILSSTDVHIVNGSMLTITSNLSVHDLSIEGGSTLNISTTGGGGGVTFGMHSLYLRGGWNDDYTEYDMPRVFIHSKSTLTKTLNAVNFDISVDSRNYYPFAVPFPVTVSAVDFANSTLAGASTYGTHYVIKEYDGENRAEKGTSDKNWKIVEDGTMYGESSATLQPGKGYILTAVSIPAYGGGVIRFPMSFIGAWTTKGEQATVSDVTKNAVSVTAYSGTAATADKRHAGWNLLGVPYMSCFTSGSATHSEGASAFITGKMELTGDPANPYGGYNEDDDVVYVTVPTHDFSEYLQYDITDDDTKLLPGWCFFVQFAKSGTLTFATGGQADDSSLPIYAPQRTTSEKPVVRTGIILSGAETSDKTTLLISDKYSADEYEINADLEKMFGNGYTLATYSLSRDTRLAYNAMSTTDAKNVIPIGFRAPEDGEYTFSLNPRYAEAAIERVDLIDYKTGEVTDLMMTDYHFTTVRTQDDERFALNVVPMAKVPTEIEQSAISDQQSDVRKIVIDDHVFIIRNGQMYDVTGKRVNVINK